MIYQGGCSFLHSPDIFVNTSLSEYFGKDLVNVNNCTEGSSNRQIFRKALLSIMKSKFDFVLIGWTNSWRNEKSFIEDVLDYKNIDKLLEESYKNILDTELGYTNIAVTSHHNIHCKLEPEGTDDVIMYTIILNQLLKLKNIPHLFITMGQLNPDVLTSRKGWTELIDPKNYYGEGEITNKMNYSITNYFYELHINEGHSILNQNSNLYQTPGYIIDNTAHLNLNGAKKLAELIKYYLIENNIII
jgi:hypothetical protein